MTMPYALPAMAVSQALDLWRRASTRLLAVAGVALILSLRYFSAFGLGYEVVQLQELSVYTIGLMGALAAFVFHLPREDDSAEAELALLVRPVSPAMLSLGAWLGKLLVLVGLTLLWFAALAGALAWFAMGDPRLFSYRGATSPWQEAAATLLPVWGQFCTAALLVALAQPVARARKPFVTALVLLGLYALGFAAPSLGAAGALLPDLARHDLTGRLWGDPASVSPVALLAHAAAWCGVGLAVDALLLRVRLAV